MFCLGQNAEAMGQGSCCGQGCLCCCPGVNIWLVVKNRGLVREKFGIEVRDVKTLFIEFHRFCIPYGLTSH